jgi:hypothetical protein
MVGERVSRRDWCAPRVSGMTCESIRLPITTRVVEIFKCGDFLTSLHRGKITPEMPPLRGTDIRTVRNRYLSISLARQQMSFTGRQPLFALQPPLILSSITARQMVRSCGNTFQRWILSGLTENKVPCWTTVHMAEGRRGRVNQRRSGKRLKKMMDEDEA